MNMLLAFVVVAIVVFIYGFRLGELIEDCKNIEEFMEEFNGEK